MKPLARTRRFFKNRRFDFATAIALGSIYHKGADAGEIFSTIGRIRDGDAESWHREWLATGERVLEQARKSSAGGHTASAQEAYLRAAGHFFRATSTLDGTADPSRLLPTWRKSRECWHEFTLLHTPTIERVEIPFEGTTLPGYRFKVDGSGRPRPTLILANGADGPIHNMWLWGAAAALDRGYNAITFDGPGQGETLLLRKIPFRHDWENVITPVVDFLLGCGDVDPDRIALSGVSQGGHWVLRALAYEHRIAAGIADPGVPDASAAWIANLPKRMLRMLDDGEEESFNKMMRLGTRFSRETRQYLAFRMRPYGTLNPFAAFQAARRHRADSLVAQIRCPVFIADPDGEQYWPGQSRRLYDALTCPKTLARFTADEGADSHCEPMARSLYEQRMFDWLDGVFGR